MERKPRRFAKDIAHGDVFSDYLDRAHTDTFGLEYEELDGYTITSSPATVPIDNTNDVDAFVVELLREVLAETRQERELMQKRANLRRWMDEAIGARPVVLT